MNDAQLIRESYSEIERMYLQRIDNAVSEKDFARHAELQERFRICEYAFFVLFWGQLETHINSAAFEMEGEDYTRLGLMIRVGLSISANHEFYEDIDKFYYWRCKLAHGKIRDFPELNLSMIFDRIEEIAEAMDKGPLPLGDIFADFY